MRTIEGITIATLVVLAIIGARTVAGFISYHYKRGKEIAKKMRTNSKGEKEE
jgi:hypothetical protein